MVSLITQEMVGDLGSLYLTGMWLDRYELTLAAKKVFLRILVVFFFMHKSLRNLMYVGTCWIMSILEIMSYNQSCDDWLHPCIWIIDYWIIIILIFSSQNDIFLELLYCDEVPRTMLVYDKKRIYRIVLKQVRDQIIRHYGTMMFIEWRLLCAIWIGCPLNQGVWWH